MSIEVNIGDVFYKIEPTDHKHYHRKCRVCEDKRKITVNGITFKCPMCQSESEVLRVHGFLVRRYRVFSITNWVNNSDWKYDGEKPFVKYGLYHKSGRGYYSYSCDRKEITVDASMFSDKRGYFNCTSPSRHSIDSCLYSDYKLAVTVANKLTQDQIEMVRAYNEEHNTDYELPVFAIEHDKKSN